MLGLLLSLLSVMLPLAAASSSRTASEDDTGDAKSGSSIRIISAVPDPALQMLVQPIFPLSTEEWTGGDSSASIALRFADEVFSLWIYGDTVLGTESPIGVRNMSHFIHNSIGLSLLLEGELSTPILKFWNTEPTVRSMFYPLTPEEQAVEYYWLMSGCAVLKDDEVGSEVYDVYLFSPNVMKNTSKWIGMDGVTVIRLKGLTRETVMFPHLYDVSYTRMPKWLSSSLEVGGNGFLWGVASTVVSDDGYVYMVGNKHNITEGILLARMQLEAFETLQFKKTQVEFYSKAATWVTGDLSNVAVVPGAPNVPETAIVYIPQAKKWVMIANGFCSPDFYLYFADEISGPYERTFLYHVPAPISTTKDLFAYAPKVHVELSDLDAGEIIFTYNSNSFHFFQQYQDPKLPMLYIPQFIRAKFLVVEE